MGSLKIALMRQAHARYGRLYPCAGRTLFDGFLLQRGRLEFWWNDATGNTHMIWAALGSPSLPAPLFS